jgi:hypothetical protein
LGNYQFPKNGSTRRASTTFISNHKDQFVELFEFQHVETIGRCAKQSGYVGQSTLINSFAKNIV